MVLDGATQPGFTSTPIIVLAGTNAGSSAKGLDLAAGSAGSTILALVINNFGKDGISIESTGNAVQSSYIGTNAAGTAAGTSAMPIGVVVSGASNTIGGITPGTGNLISGNTTYGVQVTGASATGDAVEGNLIGTDVSGTVGVSNGDGVEVDSGASSNRIGGLTATPGTGAGNVISGSTFAGVYIIGPTATGDLVAGNLIGTNASGIGALGNTYGVYINNAPANTVGGTASGAGNVLSGNSFDGVVISGITAASANLVAGNRIGTDVTGTTALANHRYGVYILDSGSGNTIGGTSAGARNIISGNSTNGILIGAGPGSTDNLIVGNYIGTDVTGTVAISDGGGVVIQTAGNTIGGSTAGAGNLISGNTVGIVTEGTQDGTVIAGNFVGTNAAGTGAIPNTTYGVEVNGDSDNTIGGTTAGAGNLISGNTSGYGIIIGGSTATGNVVVGNRIGTDVTGANALANGDGLVIEAPGNTFGGSVAAASNLISGNTLYGILVFGPTTTITGNLIAGNLIGTNLAGTAALANTYGVGLNNASGTTIGGTNAGAANLISGNTTIGIYINGATTSGNLIAGNLIGTNLGGSAAISDTVGVELTGAPTNTIGGSTAGASNVISGNTGAGVLVTGSGATANAIEGNVIGLAAGGAALGNHHGVEIDGGAGGNTIGGPTSSPGSGAGNVISGNAQDGIFLDTTAGNNTVIAGNLIGLAADGTTRRGNVNGVFINFGTGALIGGTSAQARNVISGNSTGIILSTSGSNMSTVIEGNFVGTDITGMLAEPNSTGISDGSSPGTVIGGTVAGAGNVVSGNSFGITLNGTSHPVINGTYNAIVEGNLVGLNAAGTAALGNVTGIVVSNASNLIGGSVAGAGNVVGGNTNYGIEITTASATGNVVAGNLIGVDVTGTVAVADGDGVEIDSGASSNTIGGSVAAARNLISGSNATGSVGIQITGAGSSSNVIAGNWIGLSAGGGALGNYFGVFINSGATNNTIGGLTSVTGTGAGNVISANVTGVSINDATTTGTVIEGNLVGTDQTGTSSLGTQQDGIYVGGPSTTVGGTSVAARNVISGNTINGIEEWGGNEIIQGNFIGTDITGASAVGNFNDIELNGFEQHGRRLDGDSRHWSGQRYLGKLLLQHRFGRLRQYRRGQSHRDRRHRFVRDS